MQWPSLFFYEKTGYMMYIDENFMYMYIDKYICYVNGYIQNVGKNMNVYVFMNIHVKELLTMS